ncbi:MAG: TrmB family transcriptional regulator sugar-binding domain-containing protein [Gammaproteobacteria bacterium]|nr:TrmB family transcriptional regulator sugar-binding domain-containing protein [Gammaproteobacteria bacterium]
MWPLRDSAEVAAKAGELLASAQDVILASAWPEELDWLADHLHQAVDRGVDLALVHFGEPQYQIGATYHHPVERTLHAEKGGRGLTLVADSEVVVIATFRDDGTVDGA